MQKGAVWLSRDKRKIRLRRASKLLKVNDVLELNYNPRILNLVVPEPQLIHDAGQYSIWFKPYGLYCQGSRWGDFASINRWVEIHLSKVQHNNARPVFLVQRLDRATSGLILLCHSKTSAAMFSKMFRKGEIRKFYQAVVKGDFSNFPQQHKVSIPVDEKPAESRYTYIEKNDTYSLLDIELLTGRKHQIRQQLSTMGFPIVGDRLYGSSDEENIEASKDLQLQSIALQFTCPFTSSEQHFSVDDTLKLSM